MLLMHITPIKWLVYIMWCHHWKRGGAVTEDHKCWLLFSSESIVYHGLPLLNHGLPIVDYGLPIEILWASYCYNMGLHGLRDLGLGVIQKVTSPCWGGGVKIIGCGENVLFEWSLKVSLILCARHRVYIIHQRFAKPMEAHNLTIGSPWIDNTKPILNNSKPMI